MSTFCRHGWTECSPSSLIAPGRRTFVSPSVLSAGELRSAGNFTSTVSQDMPYEIEITRSEPVWTAVVKGRMSANELSQFVPAACGEAWSFIRSAHLPRPGRNVALYGDAGAVEAGMEVSEPFDGSPQVHCSQLPAGRVAHTVHFGPYGGLGEAHAAIRKWCAEQGHLCTGACWELYGHWQESWNADPSQIRTDVFYLLGEGEEVKSW